MKGSKICTTGLFLLLIGLLEARSLSILPGYPRSAPSEDWDQNEHAGPITPPRTMNVALPQCADNNTYFTRSVDSRTLKRISAVLFCKDYDQLVMSVDTATAILKGNMHQGIVDVLSTSTVWLRFATDEVLPFHFSNSTGPNLPSGNDPTQLRAVVLCEDDCVSNTNPSSNGTVVYEGEDQLRSAEKAVALVSLAFTAAALLMILFFVIRFLAVPKFSLANDTLTGNITVSHLIARVYGFLIWNLLFIGMLFGLVLVTLFGLYVDQQTDKEVFEWLGIFRSITTIYYSIAFIVLLVIIKYELPILELPYMHMRWFLAPMALVVSGACAFGYVYLYDPKPFGADAYSVKSGMFLLEGEFGYFNSPFF